MKNFVTCIIVLAPGSLLAQESGPGNSDFGHGHDLTNIPEPGVPGLLAVGLFMAMLANWFRG
jgi:hypothetical protein